ncbi:ketopantoate reductase family protein [Nocardioides taihuensis]|uniref:2-dehydropantoate 2-reductase n=1 Tax=Nocardioides taihuensis TaxID=1835606 RepID=A0ABW0BGI8_9ACTN
MTRYVVLGAGAVGGVVGARLELAGFDVSLVARGEHLARLRADGLTLETPVGTEVLEVHVAARPGDLAWAGSTVVLLAVKSQQTAAALDDLAAHAPPETPVVCLQNGVANEAAVLRRFENTYGICVMLPSGHLAPGRVVQRCHPVPGILDVGRYPGGVDDTCEQVSEDLRRAGFASVPRPDIMAWKHRKLLMNLGNAVQATFAPGDATDRLLELVRDEGEAVLAAAGIPVVSVEQDRERRGDLLQSGERHPDIRGGSTWQSVARGTGDVETDYLTGEVVLLGRLNGVPTPANVAVQEATRRLVAARGPVASLDAAEVLATL